VVPRQPRVRDVHCARGEQEQFPSAQPGGGRLLGRDRGD
jgi:hypothetical protein